MKKITFLIVCCIMYAGIYAQSWLITGNSGTTTGTNFVGTKDNNALMFKVNNQRSGYIDFASGKANTSFGFRALINPTGNSNVAFGYKAGSSNTTGNNNVSVGAYALFFTTTGYSNIAMGIGALYKNTKVSNVVAIGDSALYNNGSGLTRGIEPYGNTAIGSKTLYSNTFGYNNTATGFQSLYSNTFGNSNTANGYGALYANTIGSENVAYGYQALYSNTAASHNVAVGKGALYSQSYNPGVAYISDNVAVGYEALYYNQPISSLAGSSNTAIGSYALHSNTTGYYNTACGDRALFSNTTADFNTACGISALANNTADNNTATGADALNSNTTGNKNTADGNFALQFNSTGSQNTSVGYFSLHNTSASDGNTAVGYGAGYIFNNGYYNVFVGANTDVNGSDYYNVIAIGQSTICTTPNQVTMGNLATVSYRAYANWSNISDGRYKKNMREDVPGLQFINKLKPVSYTLDATAIDNFLHKNIPADKNISVEGKAVMEKGFKEKEQIRYTGFVAQEVEKAAKELNYDFSGVDAAKNENDVYGLRYAEFVVPLVKAVQELSSQNDKLKVQNEQQERINISLQKQINELKALLISQGKENMVDKKQTASSQQ